MLYQWQCAVSRLIWKNDPDLSQKLFNSILKDSDAQEHVKALSLHAPDTLSDEVSLMNFVGKPKGAIDLVSRAQKTCRGGNLSLEGVNLRVLFVMSLIAATDYTMAQRQASSLFEDLRLTKLPDKYLATMQMLQAELCEKTGQFDQSITFAKAAAATALQSYDCSAEQKAFILDLYAASCSRAGNIVEANKIKKNVELLYPKLLREYSGIEVHSVIVLPHRKDQKSTVSPLSSSLTHTRLLVCNSGRAGSRTVLIDSRHDFCLRHRSPVWGEWGLPQ